MTDDSGREDVSKAAPRGHAIPDFGRTYQRGRRWWIRYTHRGRDMRESAKSTDERAAYRLLKDRYQKIARKTFAGPHEDKVTVGDLLDGLERDYQAKHRRSLATLKSRLAPLRAAFGETPALNLIGSDAIDRFVRAQQADGYADATINRQLAALRRAFTIATRARRLSDAPIVELLPESNVRQGFVEPATFETVVGHLPDAYQDFARFAYRSAWRKGEVQSLEWRDVDRAAGVIRLRPEHSKTAEGRPVPLIGDLAEIIGRRWAAREYETADGGTALSTYVFHRQGRPIGDIRKAWTSAVIAAGLYHVETRPGPDGKPVEVKIPILIFHDLRRSGIRNLERAGVSQVVAMKLSGHRTASVYRRYRIVSDDDVRDALSRADSYARQAPASNVVELWRAKDGQA